MFHAFGKKGNEQEAIYYSYWTNAVRPNLFVFSLHGENMNDEIQYTRMFPFDASSPMGLGSNGYA
jgi:hypothetical protein